MEDERPIDSDPRQKPLQGLDEEPRKRYPLGVWAAAALVLLALAFLIAGWVRVPVILAVVALLLFGLTFRKGGGRRSR